MVTVDRVSRWVMYFGVFAFLGALVGGNPLSATFGAILIAQYPVLQFYRGFAGAKPASKGTAVEE